MNYAIKNCIILDGTKDMKPISGQMILVQDERIQDLVPDNTAIPDGYRILDLQGKYILPGLVNLHVHLATEGKAPKASSKPKNYRKIFQSLTKSRLIRRLVKHQEAGYAKTALMSGVTTLRTVGGVLDFDAQNRDAINQGKQAGPRILSSNMAISVEGGHFAGSIATEARSAQEAAEHVRMIAATKPDWIKLMITGGVMDSSEAGEPGMLRMPAEFVKSACDEAHSLGYKVAAHIESPAGLTVALENGVDTIEHGAQMDEHILQTWKSTSAALVCTLSPAIPYALFDLEESHATEIAKHNGLIVLKGIISCAKTCLKNQIPVGLGNDVGCPFITHYNFWRELVYFQHYVGVSNQFALYTATLRNAEIAGIDKETGSIEKGKLADLIVVAQNPLEDLHALQHVEKVMTKGNWISQPRFKHLDEVDRLLDQYMNCDLP